MANDNEKNTVSQPQTTPDHLGPVKTKIEIRLHENGQVSWTHPSHGPTILQMIGAYLHGMSEMFEYKKQSPIFAPPPGFRPRSGG